MLTARKIRLIPTPEQEILFWKSAGTARWAYNYFLAENERVYKEYLENGKTGVKSIGEGSVRKQITALKKTTHPWLKEIGSNVPKQAVKDANEALQRYFKGLSGKPEYKTKRVSNPGFYVNYESLHRTQNGFQGEKLGNVKTSEPLPKLKKGETYSNPRISYDGRYWYLSVGYEIEPKTQPLTDVSLGVDLGVKSLAVCSDGKTAPNINRSERVRKLKKRLRRKQRKLSRKLEGNTVKRGKNGKPVYARPLNECRNIQRTKAEIRDIYRKLSNIRRNHLHQTTTGLVKTKPFRIVLEDLNVRGMMKNRHLAEVIAEQGFREFRRQITYKCERHGIALVFANRFYSSSKKCSRCGHIKRDLKLSERSYHCPHCGLVIDRDFNAAVNLANYESYPTLPGNLSLLRVIPNESSLRHSPTVSQ